MAFDLKGLLKIGMVGAAGYLGYQVIKQVGGALPSITGPGGIIPKGTPPETPAERPTVPPAALAPPTEANLITAATNRAAAASIAQKFNFDQWTYYRGRREPDHGIVAENIPWPEGIDRSTPLSADQYHGLLELAGYESFTRGFSGYHTRRWNLVRAGVTY